MARCVSFVLRERLLPMTINTTKVMNSGHIKNRNHVACANETRTLLVNFHVVIVHFCWHFPFMHKSVILWEMMTSADANVERKCSQKSSKNKVKTPLINSSTKENILEPF